MSDNETVADIVAEMRERADAMQTHGTTHGVRLAVLEFARRIDAAWKREARAITTEHAVLPAVCITKPSGNAEAMREACKKILDLLMLRGDGKTRCVLTWDEFNESQKMLRAALSAPARNCDLPNTTERYNEFCYNHRDTKTCCEKCPFNGSSDCEAEWLLSPAEEQKGVSK